MESKEAQKTEEINLSSNQKPETQSEGVQTTEKNKDTKIPLNKTYISFKELFINTEDESDKKDQSKQDNKSGEKNTSTNEEEIKIIHQLFNIPPSSPDSFKNKDYKLRFITNKNIKFENEFTVKYTGKGISKIDYGIVQTEKEILNKRPIFYYEANIIEDGKEADLLIGIGEKDITEKGIQLGLTTYSYGYHSKGKSYNNKKQAKYGETFAKGDIIGCGVDFINKSIFYTKNGKFLDFAFKDINFELNKGYFYPSICMHTLNIEIKLNFGNEDFKFDINNYYENILIKKYNVLQSFNPKYDDMDYLVKEYLFHEGYMNTFKSMIKKEKNKKKENKDKMVEDDNDDLYLDIDDNLQIEENKNRINIGDDAMDIEEDNNDNDEYLIENIIKLLPKENNDENKDKNKENTKDDKSESSKKEKKEDKKDDKKSEKKEDKKEDKKEEDKKEEKKEDKKEDDKKENKKEDKKEDKKEEKKDEKKEEKKDENKKEEKKNEKKDEEKNKMEVEESKESKEDKEKEKEREKEKEKERQIKLQKDKENMKRFISLRNKLLTYLTNKEFDKAISLVKEKYSNIKEKEEIYKKIYFSIVIMKYLTLLKNENNYMTCFELIGSLEKEYWEKFKISLYENNSYNKTSQVALQSLATLVSQPDILNSEYAFFLSDNQINLIKQQINSLLFELINLSPLSNLNKIYSQLEYMNELYYKVFNCNQELSMKIE